MNMHTSQKLHGSYCYCLPHIVLDAMTHDQMITTVKGESFA
jgi:hypothetical protein